MNKMIKGAAFAGVGVALLLGGGGTLANWNDRADSKAGAIVAGDLELNARDGVWTDADDKQIDVATYRIIPGEELTYTQTLDVVLEGTNMQASVAVSGGPENIGFDGSTAVAGPIELETIDGLPVTTLTESTTLIASTTFTFSADDTASKKAKYDFSKVSYVLTQQTETNN